MHGPAGKSGIRLDTVAYLAQCQGLVATAAGEASDLVSKFADHVRRQRRK